MSYKLLILNLGGTSSKVSIYEDETLIVTKSLLHSAKDMEEHPLSKDQVQYRKDIVKDFLAMNGYTVDDFDAMVLRAPPFRVKKGGTYLVEGKCREIIMDYYHPDDPPIHGNRIVLPVIDALLEGRKTPIYLVDPDMVDEFPEIAHVSGIPGIARNPSIHYLNQKAVARKYASDIGKKYEELRLIVCHMGGGMSSGAHEYGRAIDSNEGSEGWGPFSADRAGTVATGTMLHICYDLGLTKEEAHKMVRGNAGLKGLLGTVDLREVEKRIDEGDKKAELVFSALAFQLAKEIGSCYAVLCGKVDAILFTGGMANSKRLIAEIKKYVGSFAPFALYPGEMEQEALALGTLRVLRGEEKPVIME